MRSIRVLVWGPSVGSVTGSVVWLANALEHDIAAQGGSLDEVVEILGDLFDAHDAALRARDERIEPPPEAPAVYATCWEDGEHVGERQLGASRKAIVRTSRVDPYERYIRERAK